MIVCLDSGNSRIKWGVHDGQQWLAQGAVAHAEVGQLAALTTAWARPTRVLLANVAGREAAAGIRRQLAAWLPMFQEVKAEAKRGGVTNLYRNPEQLGVDRWCALIGARSLTRAPCVVVGRHRRAGDGMVRGPVAPAGPLLAPLPRLDRVRVGHDVGHRRLRGAPWCHGLDRLPQRHRRTRVRHQLLQGPV